MSYHQTIYNRLRQGGLTEAAALGMLGNWECESGCEPYRVQGDYQASRAISKAYVNAIETGVSDRERFATDQKGFGLAQWTYPQRKRNLWDAWEADFCRIDDVAFQVEFAVDELRCVRGKQRLGMCLKGNGTGSRLLILCHSAAGLQQSLMAQMYTIEKTQGKYFFHKMSPFEKGKFHTAKKLLTVDIMPSSAFASIKNSPV